MGTRLLKETDMALLWRTIQEIVNSNPPPPFRNNEDDEDSAPLFKAKKMIGSHDEKGDLSEQARLAKEAEELLRIVSEDVECAKALKAQTDPKELCPILAKGLDRAVKKTNSPFPKSLINRKIEQAKKNLPK